MINEALKQINVKSQVAKDELQQLIYATLGEKNPSNIIKDIRIILRESIFYRLDSVNFHLELLKNENVYTLNKMKENMFFIDERLIGEAEKNLLFIFDDIIFNLCSMFDYVGDLFGYLFINSNNHSTKWTGIAKSSRDDKNAIYKYNIAQLIDREDRLWIGHLYDYRSKLIHYKKDNTNSIQKLEFSTNQVNIIFHVDQPKMFKSIIKEYRKNQTTDDGIIEVAIWTILKAYCSIEKFFNTAAFDINNRIKA